MAKINGKITNTTFTDQSALAANNNIKVKKIHITELRNAVAKLNTYLTKVDNCGYTNCCESQCDKSKQCTDTCQSQCNKCKQCTDTCQSCQNKCTCQSQCNTIVDCNCNCRDCDCGDDVGSGDGGE